MSSSSEDEKGQANILAWNIKDAHFHVDDAKILQINLQAEEKSVLYKLEKKIYGIISKDSKMLPTLEKADISWLRIGEIGALYVSSCKWVNIQHLHLNGSYIGDRGCKILSSTNWEDLKTLELYQNDINVSGAIHISKARWKNLDFMHFGINSLTNDGIVAVMKANWVKLTQLYIYNNGMNFEIFAIYSLSKWELLNNLHTEMNSLNSCETRKANIWLKAKFAKLSSISL